MQKRLAFVAIWLATVIASDSVNAQNPLTPEQEKATAAIHEYFRRTTTRLASESLADIKTLDDWQNQRPRLREQLLEMLGLSPLPERTDLHATVTSTVEHEEFIVEKLHFQSRPGLYVTANFYRPKLVDKPLPTILYLCGHGNVKIDGVSYGSKASYQHHPAWFAREGYCSLILDTLQLGEIEGLHHGTYREGMWWWPARGYTPAGVEAWNAVRALDYLETRPEVDMKRIGVTGRSGGGAYTWWLAGIDDRPACLIPVAGITDLQNHVVDGCIEGHCDCMYMVNTYQWDFPTLAAFAAPRPLLFSNTDKDKIFPLDGVVRTHAKLKKIYDLYGAADKLGLLITEGPHKDTQELQVPAFRWMNRWLQNRDTPITRVADKPLDPKQLKVFDDLPVDQRNTMVHEWFVPRFEPAEPPKTRDEWESLRERWLAELKGKSFRGWPSNAPPPELKLLALRKSGRLRRRLFEFTTEENLKIRVLAMTSFREKTPESLLLKLANDDEWNKEVAAVCNSAGEVLSPPERESQEFRNDQLLAGTLETLEMAGVWIAPRGLGSSQWNPEAKKDTHILRRFLLIGQTADEGRVWDVCRCIEALRSIDEFKDTRIGIRGDGALAGIAMYSALLSPSVELVQLHRPTVSHRDGPFFPNVLRILDLPQAAAMFLPRRVSLYGANEHDWQWAVDVGGLYAEKPNILFAPAREEGGSK